MTAAPPATVLYDADCGFCVWCMGKLLALDRRRALRPVALQDRESDVLLAGMDAERRMASWHLVDRGGLVHSGGHALAPLVALLPAGGPLARVLARAPGLVDRCYRAIAGRRSASGRLVTAGARRRARARIERRA